MAMVVGCVCWHNNICVIATEAALHIECECIAQCLSLLHTPLHACIIILLKQAMPSLNSLQRAYLLRSIMPSFHCGSVAEQL
jgi:hypothetical protein